MAKRKPSKWQLPLRIERRYGHQVPREPAELMEPSLHAGITLDEVLAACGVFLNELGQRTGVRPVAPYERQLHGRLVNLMLGQPEPVFSTLGVYLLTTSVAPHRVLYVGKSTDASAMIRGRLLAHLLPSGGREAVAARLREAMTQMKRAEMNWREKEQCLRRAVFGANTWSRRMAHRKPQKRVQPLAAARLVAEGAFDVTVIALHGDGAEYAPALEWMALEAARRRHGGFPPLNSVHAMLGTNGYHGLKSRWNDMTWRSRVEDCAAAAMSALLLSAPGRLL